MAKQVNVHVIIRKYSKNSGHILRFFQRHSHIGDQFLQALVFILHLPQTTQFR